jgi:hypothetical protein
MTVSNDAPNEDLPIRDSAAPRVRVFVSYSHLDKQWIEGETHSVVQRLAAATRRLGVEFWTDRNLNLEPGEYEKRIALEIDRADVALLLLSLNFASSDFIPTFELPRIRERYENKDRPLKVFPVLVGPLAWELFPDFAWIEALQVVPGLTVPLVSVKDNDAKWAEAMNQILVAFVGRYLPEHVHPRPQPRPATPEPHPRPIVRSEPESPHSRPIVPSESASPPSARPAARSESESPPHHDKPDGPKSRRRIWTAVGIALLAIAVVSSAVWFTRPGAKNDVATPTVTGATDAARVAQVPPHAAVPVPSPVASSWRVVQIGSSLRIHYGSRNLQYAVLHTDSGYFRMNAGDRSGWGTSVVLLPSFWAGGTYHQGGPVLAAWKDEGADLRLSFSATMSTMEVRGEVRLEPPGQDALVATVTVTVSGAISLDRRPGEAFKPVLLSSMHVSDAMWDARSAFVDAKRLRIPEEGWIVEPPALDTFFGLTGGTSSSKVNVPTIDVLMDRSLQVTGWVTRSTNPTDNNVAFWAASDEILRRWRYRLRAVAP